MARGQNKQRGKCAKQTPVQECLCNHCGREFVTRDMKMGTKMLRLHLLKEHKISNHKITNFGHTNTLATPENSTGTIPWANFAPVPQTTNPN